MLLVGVSCVSFVGVVCCLLCVALYVWWLLVGAVFAFVSSCLFFCLIGVGASWLKWLLFVDCWRCRLLFVG